MPELEYGETGTGRAYDTIDWSFDDASGIGRVTLDRPNVMNAIDATMQDELADAFERFRVLDGQAPGVAVRAVVLEGAGERAFSSGLDVSEMHELDEYCDRKRIPEQFVATTDAITSCEAPVVAQIDGLCLGGGLEVGLACDFRLASERSTFGQPEVTFGLLPGGGAAQRLSSMVGVSRAKELCMTGEHIDAVEAATDGIVDHVHPAGDLASEVESFVERLTSNPPLAVRAVKEAADLTEEVGMDAALRYGARAWQSLAETRDHEESMAAFGTDRDPDWEGR